MSERPIFPPLLRPVAVTPELDPFVRGLALAADGAEAGTFLWSTGRDRCECAVVLAPEQSLERSVPIALIALLGLGDALGALVPPGTAVTFGWPDRIEVNGGVVGGVRLAHAETGSRTDVPDWMVVGIGVAVRGQRRDAPGGHRPTTLHDEGCSAISAIDLLEAFARHFLSWTDRWQDDGIEPVRQAWLSRATGLGKPIELELGATRRRGTFAGLTESGALRLMQDGVAQTISLDAALKVPTWSA